MPLLFESDYEELRARGLTFVEDESLHRLVLRSFELPEFVYTQTACDVLVEIPPNYNQGGNDMFWTFPKLERADGRPIPNTGDASCDPRTFEDKLFFRWSRHWHSGSAVWQPGKDNIVTIVNRLTWAFNHPDTM